MRIGFDAKRAAQNRTGLGNYSRFVLQLLADYAPGNEYVLYAPDPGKTTLLNRLPGNFRTVFPTSAFWKKLRSLWRVWGITDDLARDGIEVYHGLSNELPLNIRRAGKTKSVVTIHDLIFLHYPQCYPPIDRWIYNYKFRKACRQADRIIAVSECTKRDIVRFYHIPEEKIDVVYQGCDVQFKQEASAGKKNDVRGKYRLPGHYILYLGSIERRKNLMLLARALCHLPDAVEVVAVGKRTPYAGKVEAFLRANGLEGRMRLIHGVPFDELPALYQMADVFVYPSFYEGFGIPILEALHSGTPVIGATGSCLEEAGGPASLYVDPHDPEALARAIGRVLGDGRLRETMIAEGRKYAARFEDPVLAKDLLEVYGKL